ncbi:hypothetical protein [Arthrobacter sp. ISL-28]|uniref:hypothetical protein n=1 Tax=Arthrobacter sp. ISL-28 TaxID=2819108 RepID=UPI001BEA1788|nr:hypothetical protein [Arthrobacter sp. ISL-28]MBT2519863.1 hypothetical protein [Arthrobacter sp. ISL-28]
MMPRASFRLFRTGLIASIVFGLAAGGHLAGAGSLPAPAVLAALCAVTMVPVAALTRFRLSFPVLTGLIGAGQIWLHWAFSALSDGAPAAVPPALLSGHAGHSGHAAASVDHESLALAAQAHTAAPDGLMLAAHTVATLGTALVLARGEQALGVLADWLRPLLGQREPATIVPARVPGACLAAAVLSPTRLGVRLPARRGPPLSAPAA